MAGAVMRPLTSQGAMQPRDASGRPMAQVVGEFIKPNDRLTSFERLEIYNRQYWFRLLDCFYDDYPGLRAVLGDRRFDQLAHAYLEHHPSSSFTLRNLGRRLIAFLEEEPKWIEPRPQFAMDMARLEWAHVEAFDNEARPALAAGVFAASDPETLRLRLQPHITLLQLSCEADNFLISVKQGSRLRGEASNAVELHPTRARARLKRQLKARETFLAVHRHQDSVYYKRLERVQFALLTELSEGASVAHACGEAAALEPARDWGTDLRRWFSDWAGLGWFCK